jgi:hypothetical protein
LAFGVSHSGCVRRWCRHGTIDKIDDMLRRAKFGAGGRRAKRTRRFRIPVCGCGSIGHTSNYACYVAGKETNGELIYDSHALACSICVDITQDAMRLLDQGQEVSEIRAYIDRNYSAYGPSNMP